jgi:hypothetical protein
VFQVAQLLAEMEQEALLSGPDSPRKGLLPGLQAGSTGAVVGANSWLIFHSRQNETAPLQLLPLPTGRTNPLTPVHTVSLAVYRGTKAQEPAHYRTANELARFLATEFSVWAAGAGMGVPATRAGLQDWADRAGTTHSGETSTSWYNTEAAVAWTLATGIPARPFCPHHQQQIDSYYSEVLGPALMLLLEGKLDPEEFAQRTTEQ